MNSKIIQMANDASKVVMAVMVLPFALMMLAIYMYLRLWLEIIFDINKR